jgi:hypothetical protein
LLVLAAGLLLAVLPRNELQPSKTSFKPSICLPSCTAGCQLTQLGSLVPSSLTRSPVLLARVGGFYLHFFLDIWFGQILGFGW